ncbi:MAG: hypothetical protein QOF51_3664 [Chloroflexota bacterium]|nr:hypothetical protein [Chloroflexota bacterium]
MARAYRYISSDAHLEIGPDRWRDRVPEKFRDRAPRLIQLEDGGDAILVESSPLLPRFAHNAGVPFEQWGPDIHTRFEDSPGAGPPAQRLREQDRDGVDAEIIFAGVGGQAMWGNIGSEDVYNAVVRAYNDFLAEDYMPADRDRLLCMGLIPNRGVKEAMAELERCAKLGFKGVCLSGYPAARGLPSPEDDPFWEAALAVNMPVTIHTEFRGTPGRGDRGERGYNLARRISTYGVKGGPIAAALAVHGVFERFPTLQIFIAENQICWIPGFLQQMDLLHSRHRYFHERLQGLKPIELPPSQYVREHISWGFMDDQFGVSVRHHIGVNRVMWSTDFPHDPSDWPHSMDTVAREFAGVPEDEKQMMVCGNAVEFFHLDVLPAAQGAQQRVAQTV